MLRGRAPRRAPAGPGRTRFLIAAALAILLALGGALPVCAATQGISFVPGFNFVSIAVSGANLTSESLMRSTPGIVGVYRYDQAARRYVSQLDLGGGDFDGTAFELAPGEGYILRATAAGAISLSGSFVVSPPARNLEPGFAIVSFGTRKSSSIELFRANSAIVGAYAYDPVARAYQAHLNLGGGDFDGGSILMGPGKSYVIRAKQATAFALPIGAAPVEGADGTPLLVPKTDDERAVAALFDDLATGLRTESLSTFMTRISPNYRDADLATGFADRAEVESFLADKFTRYTVIADDPSLTYFILLGATIAPDRRTATALAESKISVVNDTTGNQNSSPVFTKPLALERGSDTAPWVIVSGIPNRRDL